MKPGTDILFGKWAIPQRGRLRWWQAVTPPQLFVLSFMLLILLGTVGLKTLPGLYAPGKAELSWLNALFTSTSAVCVTGLIVVETHEYFSTAGQAFLLLLIQLGGLGILTFTSVIIVALGRRLSLRQEALSGASMDVAPHVSRRHLVRDVVLFTLILEAAGAIALYLLWAPGMGWGKAAWPALFHSVSAFCNAGFSTNSDSLTQYQQSPFTLVVIMALVVVGGLGFLTLEELHLRRRGAKTARIFRVSLHSRLVLLVTGVLLIAGWALFSIFEWNVTLEKLPLGHKLMNSLFMSVTSRTAGFNTVDYGKTTASTNFFTVILMSIGGAPGSMAGGIKVTTVALIALLAWSRFRGREMTSFAGRSVPEETIQRAVGLFVVAFGLVTAGIFILTTTELAGESPQRFLQYMFEATSAMNTVGLSMGVTADLSPQGRWTSIMLMFLGRVGPLTLAAALARRRVTPAEDFRYAYEDVVVG